LVIYSPIEKIDAFSAESKTFSELKKSIFHVFLSNESEMLPALFLHIFHAFFNNSENATKSKFRQETMNILSTLKFTGSHLAFYE
jgi:hypothetical protein